MRIHKARLVPLIALLYCDPVLAGREHPATSGTEAKWARFFSRVAVAQDDKREHPRTADARPARRKRCHPDVQNRPLQQAGEVVFGASAVVAERFSNLTRTLLPLAPLVIEAPAIASNAKLAWPWLRAALPFAFVSTPTVFRPARNGRTVPDLAGPERRHRAKRRIGSRKWEHDTNGFTRSPVQSDKFADGVGTDGEEKEKRSMERGRAWTTTMCTTTEHGCARTASASEASSPHMVKGIRAMRDPNRGEEHACVARTSLRDKRHAVQTPLSRREALSAFGVASLFLTGALGGTSARALSEAVEENDQARGSIDGEFGTAEFTRKSYDEFADGYDDLDGGWAASAIGVEDLRAELLSRATGRVLEVGVGTGLNLRHYRRDSVAAIDAIDLSPGMLRQASARSASLAIRDLVRLREMNVERLDYPSDSFDTVVDTFSLCVFPNPSAALREMARVCKPTGRVLLLENSKSEFGPLAAYQDLTANYLAEKGGGKGCFWNQDVEALARGTGLRVTRSSSAFPGGLFRTLECVPIS